MDKDIQDRIDDFLLHGDTWTESEKTRFTEWIEEDEERKRQYEFTKQVISSVRSAASKAQHTEELRRAYDITTRRKRRNKAIRLSLTGIAAALVVGFFVVNPLSHGNATDDGSVRGGDDVFIPNDSTVTDSLATDTTMLQNQAR